MKLSVLHISDLHRDPENPIRNDVLLDSLQNDRRHYTAEETPAVQSPGVVIVSGDIIQGISAAEPDPEKRSRKTGWSTSPDTMPTTRRGSPGSASSSLANSPGSDVVLWAV
ncbi:MAG: hypothetical protein HYV62_02610 [Candidatus Rokubacteria bacterium]|nr:hypothetical protein [Candidatus Rokubacteria bacterium]